MKNILKFYKVKNDMNGNPRVVVHFLDLLPPRQEGDHADLYEQARRIARRIGGRVYTGKDYGGGFVFQAYNLDNLFERINYLCDDVYDGYMDKYGDVKYINNLGDE